MHFLCEPAAEDKGLRGAVYDAILAETLAAYRRWRSFELSFR
jgi:hypothetical protein